MGAPLVSVWNLALSHIGVKKVTSPTENSPAANALRDAWDVSRREALSLAPMSCNLVIAPLALISGYVHPTSDWLYAYQYPSKALRVWKIYNDGTVDKKKGEDYKTTFHPATNAKIILSNTEEAISEYSYDLQDTNLMDPNTVVAVSFTLAANVCMELVSDQKVALNMMQMCQQKASDALRLDSYEQNVKVSGSTTLLESRG